MHTWSMVGQVYHFTYLSRGVLLRARCSHFCRHTTRLSYDRRRTTNRSKGHPSRSWINLSHSPDLHVTGVAQSPSAKQPDIYSNQLQGSRTGQCTNLIQAINCKHRVSSSNSSHCMHSVIRFKVQDLLVFWAGHAYVTQLLHATQHAFECNWDLIQYYIILLCVFRVWWYICASALITCPIITSRSLHCCHATLLSWLQQFRRLLCVATTSSLVQLRIWDGYREAEAT